MVPTTWKVEVRRIKVGGQYGQEVSKTASQSVSWAVVTHACDPSYPGLRLARGKKRLSERKGLWDSSGGTPA
jgi:hypothetical protein